MAEEFVRKEHFDEYALRIDERFLGLEKRMEQGFAHAEKQREQSLVHLNQRFDDMTQSVNQRFNDMTQNVNRRFDSLEKRFDDLRTLMVVMYTPLAIAILGALVKWIFFPD